MTSNDHAADRRVTDFGDVLPNAAGQTYDPGLRAFMASQGFLVDGDAVGLDLEDELAGERPRHTLVDAAVSVVVVLGSAWLIWLVGSALAAPFGVAA